METLVAARGPAVAEDPAADGDPAVDGMETLRQMETLRRMETLRLLVGPWLSQLRAPGDTAVGWNGDLETYPVWLI
jgi:hypothetical protein